MRRGHQHRSGLTERLDHDPVGVDRHGHHPDAEPGRDRVRVAVPRVLDGERGQPARDERLQHEVQPLREPRADDDLRGAGVGVAHAAQIAGKNLAELRDAGPVGVPEHRVRGVADRVPQAAGPVGTRERRQVGQPRTQVDAQRRAPRPTAGRLRPSAGPRHPPTWPSRAASGGTPQPGAARSTRSPRPARPPARRRARATTAAAPLAPDVRPGSRPAARPAAGRAGGPARRGPPAAPAAGGEVDHSTVTEVDLTGGPVAS